jgi:molybdopterin-guanine dinucleotide biosynthesis protein A
MHLSFSLIMEMRESCNIPYSVLVIFHRKFKRRPKQLLILPEKNGDTRFLKSAIILAGGVSSRFGRDKGLLRLANKPLIKHVLDAVMNIVDERIVVVSSEAQSEGYMKVTGPNVQVTIDKTDIRGPLVGALTGFEVARGDYSLLLPCDTPLASTEVLSLLLELCVSKNAAIPRWPNGYIEPLQAAYRTRSALKAAEIAFEEKKSNLHCIVDKLIGVRYVSTLVIHQLDPMLRTFFNVNTPLDLKKAEGLMKHMNQL